MKDSKLGYTKFVEDSKLKEVEFYKEPKPGCQDLLRILQNVNLKIFQSGDYRLN